MGVEQGPAGYEFGKQKPPPKIRGSQFVKREQKIYPKTLIRNPFIPKERPAPPPPKNGS